MQRQLISSLIAALFLFSFTCTSVAEERNLFPASYPQAADMMVRVTPQGVTPANFTMRVRQGILFVYNDTVDDLITLELNFGAHAMTCFSSSTENLAFKDGQRLVSTKPLAPGNFATTCFPALGTYPYTIRGLSKFPQGLHGSIEVVWPTK